MHRGRGGSKRSFESSVRPAGGGSFGGYKKGYNSKQHNTEWVSYKRTSVEDEAILQSHDEVKVPENTVSSVKIKSEVTETVPLPKVVNEGALDKCQKTHRKDRSQSPMDTRNVQDVKKIGNNHNSGCRDDSSVKRICSASPKQFIVPHNLKSMVKHGEKKFSGRCRLFVANMNNSTTEDELRQLFGDFGETGEVYVNKEKGFGFIRLDYRHNAEMAKSCLDKKLLKGRNIQVRFATHASAVVLHGLDHFASNEYIEQAMSQFGTVERAVVVCDDRGRSKGYAIVEFEWKKSAQKVLDRFKEEMFVLGRLPKPVFAKPRVQLDEEEGLHESEIERNAGFQTLLQKKMKVQALDPESRHWLLATVTDVELKLAIVAWNGFSKEYDCWLNKENIRMPVDIRPMFSRNLISKKNFRKRKHPKRLQFEDVIYDMKQKQKFIVDTNDQYEAKGREFNPRFISPSSFEYTWAKKWRDLFIEEEDKKAKLEQELDDARYRLELEMESALKEQEAVKIREELRRRQEELRRLEEDMRRGQVLNLRAREELDRNRAETFEPRRNPDHINMHRPDLQRGGSFMIRDDLAQHNDFILQQQAELEVRRGEILRAAGVRPGMLGIRPDMIRQPGVQITGLPLPHMIAGLPQGVLTGQRGPPPGLHMGMMRPGAGPGGPPRHFSPRGSVVGDYFDHKRPRRD